MISILIPCYDYNAYPLVSKLEKQALILNINFEIICIDDASFSSKNETNQKINLSTAKENGKDSLGEKIFRSGISKKGNPACASCHGPAGHGIPDTYPRLNAQHSEYTVSQLNLCRVGKRANDTAKVMRTIAQKLTEEEMQAVADYIQGLR